MVDVTPADTIETVQNRVKATPAMPTEGGPTDCDSVNDANVPVAWISACCCTLDMDQSPSNLPIVIDFFPCNDR